MILDSVIKSNIVVIMEKRLGNYVDKVSIEGLNSGEIMLFENFVKVMFELVVII